MWVSDNLRVLVESEDQSTSSKKQPIRGARGGGQVASDGLLSQADDLRVQIIANKSETDRWISAFIEHKPLEINEEKSWCECEIGMQLKHHPLQHTLPFKSLGHLEMSFMCFDEFDTIPLQTLPQTRPPQLRCHQPPVAPMYLTVTVCGYTCRPMKRCTRNDCCCSYLPCWQPDGKISAVKTALLKRMGEFGLIAYVTVSPLIPNL
uniref:Uncharacterized protein n=1 Tax=Oncorhynchus tshawytscha TaxID=74940 RepID=A0A8C8FJ31_ONCTS